MTKKNRTTKHRCTCGWEGAGNCPACDVEELNFDEADLAQEPDDFEEYNRNEALDYREEG